MRLSARMFPDSKPLNKHLKPLRRIFSVLLSMDMTVLKPNTAIMTGI